MRINGETSFSAKLITHAHVLQFWRMQTMRRYVDLDGKTYQPPLNPTAGDALAKANAVVYAMGSLFTSIIPTLIVRCGELRPLSLSLLCHCVSFHRCGAA